MRKFIGAAALTAVAFRARPALVVALLALAVGCSVFRKFENPDARLVAVYHDIQATVDVVSHLLRTGTIKPEEAEVAHGALTVATKHADAAKDIIIAARANGRTAAPEELRRAWSAMDLATEALELARQYVASKKGVKS